MEVTCERCSTVYDFDDALVSERGTTVKCTTCSHQFKVRRAAQTTAPDLWIVRTVDGREIEFSALRDLQAAIQEVRVTRDDVLVRGNSRPRRLGSIAELEPFFNRIGVTAPPTQRRARTLAGGAVAVPPPTETSVVFTLPNVMRSAFDYDAPPPSYRRGTLPPPMPMVGRGSIPPPPPVPVGGRRPPSGRSSTPGARFGEPNTGDFNDDHSNSGVERVSALPPPPLPPRKSVPPPPPMFPTVEPPPPPFELAQTALMSPQDSTQVSKLPAPAVEKSAPTAAETRVRVSDRPAPLEPAPRLSDRPPAKDTPIIVPSPVAVAPDKPSADKPLPPASSEAKSPKATAAAITPKPDDVATYAPTSDRVSKSAITERTSAPGSSRRSDEPYSEPRYSGPVPSRRAGAARWIVGFVLVGCTALVAVTVGPKLLSKPELVAPKSDPRIDTHLSDGDRALNDGDLDAANDAYVKASALGDKDARIDLRLARVAIMHADVPWLKARLLAESDPDHANAKRELEIAATRAGHAVDRAQASAPNDADVTRCRIDTLRLTGKLAEARSLVVSLPKQPSGTSDETLFAMLDLAEQSPTWTTVIDRLSQASRAEQNLGRARGMLIYALVRSGDIAKAKTELETLVGLPRPHPLIGAFRTFIERVEKESGVAAPPAGSAAATPANDDDVLKQAVEAMEKGELERASGLLQQLEARLPNDPKVLTANGHLAQKKKDRPLAVKYFEKAIAADKNHFEAMSALADIKWESGEKQGASILYRQLIERARGSNDNPLVLRAKQRFAVYMENLE